MTLLKVDAVDYDSVNQICIGSQNTQFKEITKISFGISWFELGHSTICSRQM